MAITKCEKCEHYYGKKKEKCPKCGFANNDIEPKSNIKLIAGLITAAIFIGLFFGVKSMFTSDSDGNNVTNSYNDSRTNKQLAYNYAMDFVKERLKSPSSAEFPSLFDRQKHITELSSTVYVINSWVESQNSFGAMIKTKFSCRIKISNDAVSISDLKLLE
ncbi:MAG: hypothetical protein PF487_12565 [Bacteroidales bacterium]|jgi:hypothetical protein|nr:hypothetical protein [Bacteroidales bacterium]